jgi:hypothetical protein
MTILSLDPSSTRTGYAIHGWDATTAGETLVEAGYLKPRAADSPLKRIRAMAADFRDMLAEVNPEVVVIEWTSGKVNRRRHKGGGAGLSIYGGAAGYMISEADRAMPAEAVFTPLENDWTNGVEKLTRQDFIAALYPAYAAHMAKDDGGDVADAIGLGRWWIATEGRVWANTSEFRGQGVQR